MRSYHLSEDEKSDIWLLTRQGVSVRAVSRRLRRSVASVRGYLEITGGVRPPVRCRAGNRLTVEEREGIFHGLAAGESLRSIARRLERAPSTVSREVQVNGGRRCYRPSRADADAWRRACRPKPCKLAVNARLRALVEEKLVEDWSPQQIAGWLAVEFPVDPELRVSHETIYLTLFVQARGALRRELTAHLRTGRVIRRARHSTVHGHGHGRIVDAVPISQRPAEVSDRAVPGHWEGDLLIGTRIRPSLRVGIPAFGEESP